MPILDERLSPPGCQIMQKLKGQTMKATSIKATRKTTAQARKDTTRRVRIEYHNPNAKSVYVAGTFNDWHPQVTEMLNIEDGRWVKELTLMPGNHEYRLVVDGLWTADPACRESVPNPFGGQNSVLNVPA